MMSLPLPFEGLHEHYMDMLCRYDPSIVDKAERFNDYVDWCKWQGYGKPSEYRIDKAMQQFIAWVRAKDPMANMLPNPIVQEKVDKRKGMNGRLLLSLDMSSANYSVMRWMAIRQGIEVPETWLDLCNELTIHPFLANCKVFRQYCFGNYMPSRYATLQKHVMTLLCQRLNLTTEKLVFASHDEIVVEYPEKGHGDFLMEVDRALGEEGLRGIVNIKGTVYKTHGIHDSLLAKVVNEGASVDELLSSTEQLRTDSVLKIEYGYDGSYPHGTLTAHEFHEKKKVLVGVSGNKFYAYLRIVVLKEPLQDNDLVFEHEGVAAKWLLNDGKGRWASNLRTQ